MSNRAEDRKYHYTYKVTCSYNGRVFYGLHSTNVLDENFTGKGFLLNESKKDYGLEAHKLERLQLYETRAEAKAAYNELKATELANPIRPEDRDFHFVYKTTRFDGKYYIGVHSTDNLNDGYMGSGTYIGRSLKKHGRDRHTCQILQMCETREEAFNIEGKFVNESILKDPLCMNKMTGGRPHGNRVYGHTVETSCKISKRLKAHYAGPAGDVTRQKVSEGNRGKVRTPEMREKYKLSKSGIKFTEQHKHKLSAAKIGKPLTTKQRENHSNGQAGRCTIDGVTIFESKTALAKELGHGKAGARSPNFRYVDTNRYVQSSEQRQKARERMLGKSHDWKRDAVRHLEVSDD